MIKEYFCTGDCHGDFSRFENLQNSVPEGEAWGVIILGDAGANFWLSKRDKKLKYQICDSYPSLRFFLVRGNHEERPENISTMVRIWNEDVQNIVYWEPEYPNIFYLLDGETYWFKGYKSLVVGGAYSIDKEYRLARQAAGGYGGWFKDEQLSQEERDAIMKWVRGQHYDLILAHTCPFEWMPRDLFLPFIDQSKVDNSMELWLGELVQACSWDVFLCGHYHDDRYLAPHAQMLSTAIRPLEGIMAYWRD